MIPVSSETKNTGIIREFLLDGSSGPFYDNVDYSVHDGYVHGGYIRACYSHDDCIHDGYVHGGYIRAGCIHDDCIHDDYNRGYHKPRQWHYV